MINTLRMTIRPFTLDDIDESLEWFFDRDVMRWIPNGPDKSLADLRKRIEKYIKNFEIYGFSQYLLLDKVTEEKIGDAGVLNMDGKGMVELGYRIKRGAWGRGYATEACSAIIAHSFAENGFKSIHSMVEEENERSIHFLEKKLNFDFSKFHSFFGLKMKLYELTRDKHQKTVEEEAVS